ncbi:RGS13 protein, partial [Thryothorus ludovicianus]|nr:RGS13 protein [Thryothorus ludovicianus]
MSPCWLCKIFRAEENGISSKVSLEEMLQWSQSFENLVMSKYGPMIYKTYLKTEHNDENIEFWLACKAYKKITSQRNIYFMARKLFRRYIHPQAPSEINIDSPARKATVRNIQEPTQSCLDEAQRIIYRHTERDPYLQFLELQLYQKLKHSLQSDGN